MNDVDDVTNALTKEDLIQRADTALYAAKEGGRPQPGARVEQGDEAEEGQVTMP